MLLYNSSSNSG